VLIKGSNDHSIAQMKDALRDGLRSVANTVEDKAAVPGGGAFEIAAHVHLDAFKKTVPGKPRLGVEIFAQAMLTVPKTLLANSGFDVQERLLEIIAAREKQSTSAVGINTSTGAPMNPSLEGVWDNYCVKKQMLALAPVLAQQLLLVDEVIRAGKQMGKGG